MSGLAETWVERPGYRLRVRHGGDPQRPLVLFLHGYPDSQRMWQETMTALADRYRVASLDWPGIPAGEPRQPARRYRIAALLEDIEAVIGVLGASRLHLVGHDWGATIGWSYVTHPNYGQRVLSWSFISGPHLAIWRQWGLEGLKSLSPRRLWPVVAQLLRASYTLPLLAWPLGEALWRLGGVPAWRLVLRIAGVPKGDPLLEESREQVLAMALGPMALYRQNVLHPPPLPPRASVTCPVQLIVAERDPFVSEAGYANLGDYATDLRIARLPGSHWVTRSHPEETLAVLRGFLAEVTGAGGSA
ncbi:alpha/beta fold hydrolase [Halomonas sp. EGI 63088]|uniref:Alpha/beta fold hydrolase n=1 Tax=Halomonas flagellata TaxID=2920385 RepID=A0ABS9RRQ4_9GAMM|nr:alpha/beta fold hydrolase [Halomonas flagellata]MCH4562536.1 alpha/beta fold hydrolase [Halomonas flagellata]